MLTKVRIFFLVASLIGILLRYIKAVNNFCGQCVFLCRRTSISVGSLQATAKL